jgi:hypothetical protein
MLPRECRICLDAGKTSDLIAPCQCSGTSRWVHRRCLDTWRSQSSKAFLACTECKFAYQLEQVPHKGCVSLCCLYWLLVVRDVMLLITAVQAVVACLGYTTYVADQQHGVNGTQPLRHAVFPDDTPAVLAYYLFGWFFGLTLLGIGSALAWCCLDSGPRRETEPTCCVFYDTSNSQCNDGEGALAVLVICMAFFAIVGLFTMIFSAAKCTGKILKRHLKVLKRRVNTRTHRVVDLSIA